MDKKNIIAIIFLLLIIPAFGCAQIINPLPGLCYSDKTGSYVCLEKPTGMPKYDRGKNCVMYTQNEEEWRWCMDPSNDHIYDPYYKTRKELNEKLEQEQKLRQIESRIENIA